MIALVFASGLCGAICALLWIFVPAD